MAVQVPFVNREEELAAIDAAIRKWGARSVICINAEGGVGKTRLLQEVQWRYASAGTPMHLLVANIVDFDERTFHFPLSLRIKTAQVLNEKHSGRDFDKYLQSVRDVRKMRASGVSEDRLAQEMKETENAFVHAFNSIAKEQRIVLFYDTTEVLDPTEEKWREIFGIEFELNNCVLLIAGRNAAEIGEWGKREYNQATQFIDLQPLEIKGSSEYLSRMQDLMHIALAPELSQKLLLLAEGRPILLALAAEWLAREVPLDWLTESSKEELVALSDEEKKKRREEFEKQLVHHIANMRTLMDRLILMMARVYPLDITMVAELLRISEVEAAELFEQAESYFFVKKLPAGHISLHDEMRRMVNTYVWPDVDADGGRQRRDSELIAKCLRNKAAALVRHIAQLESDEQSGYLQEDMPAELEGFVKREVAERELWVIREQQLEHTLFTDIDKGVDLFIEIFDAATQAYRYSLRGAFFDKIEKYVAEVSPTQQFEIRTRQARHLIDSGQYDRAKNLLLTIRSNLALQPAQHVEVLIQQANVEIRLGKLLEGIDYFKQAVQIGEQYGLKEYLARAETGLGWAYRLIHDRKTADEHYQIALDLAIDLDLKPLQAMLYNSRGFVHVYLVEIPGYVDRAIWFCQQSLAISKSLGDIREQGRSYSTLGCINLIAGYFDEALADFQKALDIFEPANDIDFLSQIYSWRGSLYMTLGKLDLAEYDLKRSIDLNIKKDLPMTLSRLGRVYLSRGKLEEAEKYIEECYALAIQLPDVLYQLVALRFMSQIALTRKAYHRREDLQRKADEFIKLYGEPDDSRSLGICYFNLGLMALGESNVDQTVHYFEDGFKRLSARTRYANDTLQGQVERLEKEIMRHQPSPECIREIGAKLLTFWRAASLDVIFPDIRIVLRRWAHWEEGTR